MRKKDLFNLKNGSEKAFEKLYLKYYKLIKQICFFRCHNNNLAEDITQETFIRVWNNKENIDIKRNIKYYLVTIAKNLCNDQFRQSKKKQELISDLTFEKTLKDEKEVPFTKDDNSIFKEIKDYIDQESYEILILYYVHNLKYREIAEIKETTTSTITNKASRAMRHLKEVLKKWGKEILSKN